MYELTSTINGKDYGTHTSEDFERLSDTVQGIIHDTYNLSRADTPYTATGFSEMVKNCGGIVEIDYTDKDNGETHCVYQIREVN